MTGYDEFCKTFAALQQAYLASSNGDYGEANSKLVGALSVIIPFTVDDKNLVALSLRMEETIKRETLEILRG